MGLLLLKTNILHIDVEVTERVYDDFGISLGERICDISGKRLN